LYRIAYTLQILAQRTKGALESWERPKKSGIRVREILNAHGGETYGGAYLATIPAKITGKLMLRQQFKERSEAEKFAEDTFRGYRKQGQELFALSDQQRREIAAHMALVL
jgi:hypothetical protein